MFLNVVTDILISVGVLGGLGIIFGVLIAIFAKLFFVQEDTRVEEVTNMLPGYNCGACGHPGCNGLANAIINDGASVDSCRPIKPDQANLIREYLNNLKAVEKVTQ
jgi:electron transport complex protein RnfB